MEFLFQEHRAADAACLLVSRCGGSMSSLRLVRLLYFADRKALLRQGVTITRDRLIASEDGLSLERTAGLANGYVDSACWSEHLAGSKSGVLTNLPYGTFGSLSETARRIIGEVADEYGALSEAELLRKMQELPEWTQTSGQPYLIDPAAVMRYEGLSEEDIQEASELAESHRRFVGASEGD